MAHSHDGFGLGHLRRNTNITARFVQGITGSTVLLLTGCPPGAFFGSPAGIDFIKVPSIVKVDAEMYRPLSLRISLQKIKALRASTIQKVAEVFQPRVFLVDHVFDDDWASRSEELSAARKP